MDGSKLLELVETIELDDDVIQGISAASDQQLLNVGHNCMVAILSGPEHVNSGIGALLAIAIELAERRVHRENNHV